MFLSLYSTEILQFYCSELYKLILFQANLEDFQ